jgi:hypothetical protein
MAAPRTALATPPCQQRHDPPPRCSAGVDMTQAQLDLALKYRDQWAQQLGYAGPNMRFIKVRQPSTRAPCDASQHTIARRLCTPPPMATAQTRTRCQPGLRRGRCRW